MPITSSDLVWRLSVTSGSAGNSTAQPDPLLSLGKYISTTALTAGLHKLFDKISGARNAASEVDYRCVFVLNNHATLTLQNATVWLQGGDPAGGALVAIAVDSTAASAKGSSTAQALTASSRTAPGSPITSLAYSAPTTAAAGIAFGNLAPGACRAVWVRRSANNSAAVAAETVTLAVTGDTAA